VFRTGPGAFFAVGPIYAGWWKAVHDVVMIGFVCPFAVSGIPDELS
jgi:hypothetical protein